MPSSNVYTFADINVDKVVRDAFSQVGINTSLISGWQYTKGIEAYNFLMTSWISKRGLNLFTVEQNMLEIIPGQRLYALPKNTSKILECVLASANQIILPNSAFASSGGGGVSALFTLNGGDVLVSPDHNNITYAAISYPVIPGKPGQPIQYVGILLGAASNGYPFTFAIQCSYKPVGVTTDVDWETILEIPTQQYWIGETAWFALPYTHTARSWRVVETTGQIVTFNKISLDIPTNSIKMQRVGRDSYTYYPANSQNGISSTYYVNRNKQPTLDVWSTPDQNWQFFIYNRVRSIQDAGDALDSLDMTPRFLEACTTSLAARLARSYNPQSVESLQTMADQLFKEAATEDVENVDQQLGIDSQGYYGN